MNASKLNEWTGIISNIGVMVGIIFLIVEISQNTRAIESEVIWAHAAVATQIYTSEANNSELASTFRDIGEMSTVDAIALRDSGDPDMFRFAQTYIARVNYWQARFLTQPNAIDRERLKNTIESSVRANVVFDIMSSLQDTLHPGFASFLKDILDDREDSAI